MVAELLLSGSEAVLAALTALLVVEVTLVGVLTSGVQRVISVVAGVLLAVGFAALVDISWWSLGLLIGTSIVIGQLLRLGSHLLEVPISAMLVLALGGAESAAMDRITATLIGVGGQGTRRAAVGGEGGSLVGRCSTVQPARYRKWTAHWHTPNATAGSTSDPWGCLIPDPPLIVAAWV